MMQLTDADMELLSAADTPNGYEPDSTQLPEVSLLVGQGHLAMLDSGRVRTTAQGRDCWLDWISERPEDPDQCEVI